MQRYHLICLSVIISFSSCTAILSTNIPGTAQKSMPPEWLGKYEAIVEMPDDEPADDTEPKKYVTIENRRIIFTGADRPLSYSLDDSLRYSIAGQNRYISVLQPHGLYLVMKVIKTDSGLEVRFMLPEEEDVTKEELDKYFDKVQKITKKDDKYYKLTINEKKLDDFFKSPVAVKNFIKLTRLK